MTTRHAHAPPAWQALPWVAQLHGAATQMGRACARGWLTPSQAIATIAVRACQPRPREAGRIVDHKALIESAMAEVRRSSRECGDKMRRTRQMIIDEATARIQRNDEVRLIRWASHNINGDAGFPLEEYQVEQAIRLAAEAIAATRGDGVNAG